VVTNLKTYLLLSLSILIQSCSSCTDEQKSYPAIPDTACIVGNQFAVYDESIPEICDNIDNNCSGEIDEGCECTVRGTRMIWPEEGGPIENVLENPRLFYGQLKGTCKRGKQICRQLPEGGSEWGIFNDGPDNIGGTLDDIWIKHGQEGAILPETDLCDNIDNDCDGRVDESLKKSCWSRNTDWYTFNSPQNPDTPCRTGIQICENGHWTNCENEILPLTESCDGIDNDCNGVVDDNISVVGEECGLTSEGQCQKGSLACDASTYDLECIGYINPDDETCNDVDDDCDGDVDEELYRPCQSVCGSGFEICEWGNWGNCTAVEPTEELCNGIDDDCDGSIDEGLACACPPLLVDVLIPCIGQSVVCGQGFKSCIEDTSGELIMTECCLQSSFFPFDEPFACDTGPGIIVQEECNAYDDDCDNDIDEGLVDSCYPGPPNTRNVGRCSDGTMVCDHGRWGNHVENVFLENACEGAILPAERELCNGIDDDCDGMIDEGLNSHEKVDMVFILDQSGSMCSYVNALKQGIQPYIFEFEGTEHKFAIVDVPGTPPLGAQQRSVPPRYRVDFVDALRFNQILINWQCDNYSSEPQYDAVYMTATNEIGLSWREDAFPMQIVMTDEIAQSNRNPRLFAGSVVSALSPCQVGDCGNVNQMEVYAIVPNWAHQEWCAPSNIAIECYDLYPGIDSASIRAYLEDIFSEVCR